MVYTQVPSEHPDETFSPDPSPSKGGVPLPLKRLFTGKSPRKSGSDREIKYEVHVPNATRKDSSDVIDDTATSPQRRLEREGVDKATAHKIMQINHAYKARNASFDGPQPGNSTSAEQDRTAAMPDATASTEYRPEYEVSEEVRLKMLSTFLDRLAANLAIDGPSNDHITNVKQDRTIVTPDAAPPADLPHHYFPDASPNASNPAPSPGRPSTNTGILDGPAHLQENIQPPPLPVTGDMSRDIAPEPPAYTPQSTPLRHRRHPASMMQRHFTSRIPDKTRDTIARVFRRTWLDILFLGFALLAAGIILKGSPIWHRNSRSFPMTFDPVSGTWLGPTEYSYPRHNFYLGITTVAVMIPFIPIAVMILLQYWIRSFLDFSAVIMAFWKALALMYVEDLNILVTCLQVG